MKINIFIVVKLSFTCFFFLICYNVWVVKLSKGESIMKKAFTLIELLVVVLIIGILAAIALPQYTKAVEKSRATEAQIYLSSFVTAQQLYKLANGHYASSSEMSNLDLQLPNSKYFLAPSITDGGTNKTSVTVSIIRNNTSTPYKLVATLESGDSGEVIKRYCQEDEKTCLAIGGIACGSTVSPATPWCYKPSVTMTGGNMPWDD